MTNLLENPTGVLGAGKICKDSYQNSRLVRSITKGQLQLYETVLSMEKLCRSS